MQIDFHHGVTYVLSRLAGFPPEEAAIIAHSAQYVDDATNSGEIAFDNGAGYTRISSAHKSLDYRNFDALANARVWIPFHFLPGNGGALAGSDPPGTFIRKIVCMPDSPVARDMVARCISSYVTPHALHRLGITMHVYADTWAHQGFAGVCHPINLVRNLMDDDEQPGEKIGVRVRTFFGGLLERIESGAVNTYPLGHGAALSDPDKPFLTWSYTNGLGEKVQRNNPVDFLTAAMRMFDAMRAYRAESGAAAPEGISAADRGVIERNIVVFSDADGDARHARWKDSVAKGDFSFGPEPMTYVAKGVGSWKYDALGSVEDKQTVEKDYPFTTAFLSSNWKLFHDALQVHRLVVLHDVLPRYGISVA